MLTLSTTDHVAAAVAAKTATQERGLLGKVSRGRVGWGRRFAECG